MNETVWEFLKPRWIITKGTLKQLGVDPKEQWESLTLKQLNAIANNLQITVDELIKY